MAAGPLKLRNTLLISAILAFIAVFSISILQGGPVSSGGTIEPPANLTSLASANETEAEAFTATIIGFRDNYTVEFDAEIPSWATYMTMSPCHRISVTNCGGLTCASSPDTIRDDSKVGSTAKFYKSLEDCLSDSGGASAQAKCRSTLEGLITLKADNEVAKGQAMRIYKALTSSQLYKDTTVVAVSLPGTTIFERNGVPVAATGGGGKPLQKTNLEVWYPAVGKPPLTCAAEAAQKMRELKTGTYAFFDILGRSYFGGAGFYMMCGNDVLIAGNSEEALGKAVDEFIANDFAKLRDSGVVYFIKDNEKLNTLLLILGPESGSKRLAAAYSGVDPTRVIYSDVKENKEDLRWLLTNPAPGGKVVVMGNVSQYFDASLSVAGSPSLAYRVLDFLLFKAGVSAGVTDLRGCDGTAQKITESTRSIKGAPAILDGTKAFVGKGGSSCSDVSGKMAATFYTDKLGDYAIYSELTEYKNAVLVFGLSNAAVEKALKAKKSLEGDSVQPCSKDAVCEAKKPCVCFDDACKVDDKRSCSAAGGKIGIQKCGSDGKWEACEARTCCKCIVSMEWAREYAGDGSAPGYSEVTHFYEECEDWAKSDEAKDCDSSDTRVIPSYANLPSVGYCAPEYAKQKILINGHSYPKNFEYIYNFCTNDLTYRMSTAVQSLGCMTCHDYNECAQMLDQYAGSANLEVIGNVWVASSEVTSKVLIEKKPGCSSTVTALESCEDFDKRQCSVSRAVTPCVDEEGVTIYRNCCYAQSATVSISSKAFFSFPTQAADSDAKCPDFCVDLGGGHIGAFRESGDSYVFSTSCKDSSITEYVCSGNTFVRKDYQCQKGCKDSISCDQACSVKKCVDEGYSPDCVACDGDSCKPLAEGADCAKGGKFGTCSGGICKIESSRQCNVDKHCLSSTRYDEGCASCENHLCAPKAGICSKNGLPGTCSNGKCVSSDTNKCDSIAYCVNRGYNVRCIDCNKESGECVPKGGLCTENGKFGSCSVGLCQTNPDWKCNEYNDCKEYDSECATCLNHQCGTKEGQCSNGDKFGACSNGKCVINPAWECKNKASYYCEASKGYDTDCAICTDDNKCIAKEGQCSKDGKLGSCSGGKCVINPAWECKNKASYYCEASKGYDTDCAICTDDNKCLAKEGQCSKGDKFGTCSNGKCIINTNWECANKDPRGCQSSRGYEWVCSVCTDDNKCLPKVGECSIIVGEKQKLGTCSGGKCAINTAFECISKDSYYCAESKGYDPICATCTSDNKCIAKEGQCSKGSMFGACSNGKCVINPAWECTGKDSYYCKASKGYDPDCATCTNDNKCIAKEGQCSILVGGNWKFGACSNGKCTVNPAWECMDWLDCKMYDTDCVSCTSHKCVPKPGVLCEKDGQEGVCHQGFCETEFV